MSESQDERPSWREKTRRFKKRVIRRTILYAVILHLILAAVAIAWYLVIKASCEKHFDTELAYYGLFESSSGYTIAFVDTRPLLGMMVYARAIPFGEFRRGVKLGEEQVLFNPIDEAVDRVERAIEGK